MPRPGPSEKTEWAEERQWILTALDLKFRQQEALIRSLLENQQQLRFLNTDDSAIDAAGAWNVSTAVAPPSPPSEVDGMQKFNVDVKDYTESQDTTGSTQQIQKKVTKSLGRHTMREMGQQTPDTPLKAFVKGPLDGYMGIIVLINLGLMAVMAQITGYEADVFLGLAPPEPIMPETFFDIAEICFFVVYIADVLVRMFVLRREWYYDELEGIQLMNIFDAILAAVHAFELMLLPMLVTGDQDQRASTVRVIKLLRIVRTLRIIKTVALFRQLRLLVGTCIASIGALFWSMVMLFLVKLGFSLIICQAIQGFILDDQNDLDTRLEMNNLYGSFLKALYTMFEVTHSGSWPARVRPVIDKVSPWYSLPFLGYITLVVFAVIRVVTALFLKETLASAANDADMQIEESRKTARDYQKKLEDLFRAVDEDGNDWLSPEEFVQALSLPGVQRYLAILELKVSDCGPLFEILDDGDGKITIAEFCKGLMQLKGHARALDMVVLQRESAKVLKECQDIHFKLKSMFSTVPSLDTNGKQTETSGLA